MGEVSQPEEREYHRQSVLVTGVLGSIAFAGLILVLQSPEKFSLELSLSGVGTLLPHQYNEILVFLLALTSFSSLIGSMASAEVGAVHRRKSSRFLPQFAALCLTIGLVSFAFVLPLLIFTIDLKLGGIFMVVEGILLLVSGFLTRGWYRR
jgi:hypothetical protein